MSAIAGAYDWDGHHAVEAGDLERMCGAMLHRGPHGVGAWISPDRRMGLGHCRLAIIDPSPQAAQPMASADGQLRIVLDGVIRNHVDLRADLVRHARYVWHTDHSDAEVVLQAFEQWGIDCLELLRGSFALAIYDGRERRLWLVRDRLGVKPLYYAVRDGRIRFASEIKALLTDPGQPRAVRPESLFHGLSFVTTAAPHTMFEGIEKLEAGSWISVEADGTIRSRRWWDVWDHTRLPLGMESDDVLSEQVRESMRAAVRSRKGSSEPPVGVLVSGGIGSSTAGALFAEGDKVPAPLFTVGYGQSCQTTSAELEHARTLARVLRASSHLRLLEVDDLLGFMMSMIHLLDEPIGDPSCFPIYHAARLAGDQRCGVVLVGEGADELFGGDPAWRLKYQLEKAQKLPLSGPLKRLGLLAMRLAKKDDSHEYEALLRASTGEPVFWGGTDGFTDAQKDRLLSTRMRKQVAGCYSWDMLRPIRERFVEAAWEKTPLQWMSYLELVLRLPELLLMRVDRMCAGASVEARLPFLDSELVKLVMRIPEAVKTRQGQLGYLLRKAVRGLIPSAIVDLPKQISDAPGQDWIVERLWTWARAELVRFCRRTDYFDEQEIERMFDAQNFSRLWYLLNFALWHRYFIEGLDFPQVPRWDR